jgi:hypothetical protein
MDQSSLMQESELNKTSQTEAERQQRLLMVGLGVVGVLLLAGLIAAVWYLLQKDTPTELIRDVMIVLMAFEMLLIGIAAVLLLLQITRLVNLLQNEIKPLLEAANETIYTLRGTATFISDSFVQPVVKFNSYLAGMKRMLDLFNFNK